MNQNGLNLDLVQLNSENDEIFLRNVSAFICFESIYGDCSQVNKQFELKENNIT